MKKTFQVSSGHTVHVQSVPFTDLPASLEDADQFTKFYTVKNWGASGAILMYVGTGYRYAGKSQITKEYVVWYRNTGKLYTGFGRTIESAINNAIKDGWLYA